jgi:hypothetical protein
MPPDCDGGPETGSAHVQHQDIPLSIAPGSGGRGNVLLRHRELSRRSEAFWGERPMGLSLNVPGRTVPNDRKGDAPEIADSVVYRINTRFSDGMLQAGAYTAASGRHPRVDDIVAVSRNGKSVNAGVVAVWTLSQKRNADSADVLVTIEARELRERRVERPTAPEEQA